MQNAGSLSPPGLEKRGSLTVWSPPATTAGPRVQLLVTTRQGGVSAPPWDSMNLSPSTGDDREDVESNRELLRREAGLPDLRWLHQVHGDVIVDAAGMMDIPGGTLRADGLWTERPGIALAIGIADCVPLFVWDRSAPRLAVLHAGWRGTVQGILQRGIERLLQSGSRLAALHVALGPSIAACCYQVGDEVASELPRDAVHEHSGGTFADLRLANRLQALELGVPADNIFSDPPCTACHPEWFFSHRRLGPTTGRMWAVGWLDA